MRSTMLDVPLSPNHFLDRAGTLFANSEIVSRLCDKSLRTHGHADDRQRARRLAAALHSLGLKKGDRVATLGRNYPAHLEGDVGIPAAGGVMPTLNLRLATDEIGWIGHDAEDRLPIADDILLPLSRQLAGKPAFEKVIVFPFSGAPVDVGAGHLGADPRVRQARHLDHPGLGHDRDLADGDRLLSATRGRVARRERALPPGRDGRRAGVARRPAHPRRRRRGRAVGRQGGRRDPGEAAVITGSYHRVAPTKDKFTDDGWLRTGDVTAMDEPGSMRITDRTQELSKSKGEWISSTDLDDALMAHPAIAEAAVIAIPNQKWSKRPLACVVWKQGAVFAFCDIAETHGRHLLARGFAKCQLPDRDEVIDGLPRTSTGDVWKLELRERFPR